MGKKELENSAWVLGPTRQVQACLLTPPRLKVRMEIWQRDDDPDSVALGVEAVDGDGQLVAMVRWFAPRDIEWGTALVELRREVSALFYDLNSPFN